MTFCSCISPIFWGGGKEPSAEGDGPLHPQYLTRASSAHNGFPTMAGPRVVRDGDEAPNHLPPPPPHDCSAVSRRDQ